MLKQYLVIAVEYLCVSVGLVIDALVGKGGIGCRKFKVGDTVGDGAHRKRRPSDVGLDLAINNLS
ncbi:hypothetical protein SDC9_187523 [bioreactor metagenome]|uniref:Uncharacterized protein n=1 Tax=bioreactor metagenome TaxID=1076179 RepID=A0A645HLT4_9ZZZZ